MVGDCRLVGSPLAANVVVDAGHDQAVRHPVEGSVRVQHEWVIGEPLGGPLEEGQPVHVCTRRRRSTPPRSAGRRRRQPSSCGPQRRARPVAQTVGYRPRVGLAADQNDPLGRLHVRSSVYHVSLFEHKQLSR